LFGQHLAWTLKRTQRDGEKNAYIFGDEYFR
jgi:hypothetical protein